MVFDYQGPDLPDFIQQFLWNTSNFHCLLFSNELLLVIIFFKTLVKKVYAAAIWRYVYFFNVKISLMYCLPEFCSSYISSGSVTLNQGQCCPLGTFCNIWRYFFWMLQLQECYLTSYSEQPPQRIIRSKMSLVLLLRTLLVGYVCSTN